MSKSSRYKSGFLLSNSFRWSTVKNMKVKSSPIDILILRSGIEKEDTTTLKKPLNGNKKCNGLFYYIYYQYGHRKY